MIALVTNKNIWLEVPLSKNIVKTLLIKNARSYYVYNLKEVSKQGNSSPT